MTIPHILRSTDAGSLLRRSSKRGRLVSGLQRETIHRPISGTSGEIVEGTFIPAAGLEENHVANWLNGITEALQVLIPESILPAPTVSENATIRRILTRSTKPLTKPLRVWSSEASCKPVKGGPMSYKPDLVLQEEPSRLRPKPEFSWKDVVSFLELSSTPYSNSGSTSTVCNNVMHKAYAIFASQPGRRFLFAISIARQEFRTHMFDRSRVVHSRPYNIH